MSSTNIRKRRSESGMVRSRFSGSGGTGQRSEHHPSDVCGQAAQSQVSHCGAGQIQRLQLGESTDGVGRRRWHMSLLTKAL